MCSPTKAAQHKIKIILVKSKQTCDKNNNKKTSMSKQMVRTRSNPASRGLKKLFVTKSALKEPPRPMGWDANTVKSRGNTTPWNRSNKQHTSANHKQPLKNDQNHITEDTGIQQKENNKTISHATIG